MEKAEALAEAAEAGAAGAAAAAEASISKASASYQQLSATADAVQKMAIDVNAMVAEAENRGRRPRLTLHSSPSTAVHSRPQPSTAFHSGPQRSTAFHSRPQPSTAFHSLPQRSSLPHLPSAAILACRSAHDGAARAPARRLPRHRLAKPPLPALRPRPRLQVREPPTAFHTATYSHPQPSTVSLPPSARAPSTACPRSHAADRPPSALRSARRAERAVLVAPCSARLAERSVHAGTLRATSRAVPALVAPAIARRASGSRPRPRSRSRRPITSGC